jgi:hypothetical protein
MQFRQFCESYKRVKPDGIRVGQHFINLFIKGETDPSLDELWNNTDVTDSIDLCLKVIERYQWDLQSLRVINKEYYNSLFNQAV